MLAVGTGCRVMLVRRLWLMLVLDPLRAGLLEAGDHATVLELVHLAEAVLSVRHAVVVVGWGCWRHL